MERNVDRTVDSGLKWYEGPEWEGWEKHTVEDAMSLIGEKRMATVDNDGILVFTNITTSMMTLLKCAHPEHARQIGEAWVNGWS